MTAPAVKNADCKQPTLHRALSTLQCAILLNLFGNTRHARNGYQKDLSGWKKTLKAPLTRQLPPLPLSHLFRAARIYSLSRNTYRRAEGDLSHGARSVDGEVQEERRKM